MTLSPVRVRLLAAGFAFLGGLAAILAAWGFQLIGHYLPCKLCLEERIPYYIGLPVALAALVAAWDGRRVALVRVLLLATAAVFAYGAWLGVYHAGVEWGWWPGPTDCGAGAGGVPVDAGGLLDQLSRTRIVPCDRATWRFPDAAWGLSFAGWNAAVSMAIVVVSLAGALSPARRRQG